MRVLVFGPRPEASANHNYGGIAAVEQYLLQMFTGLLSGIVKELARDWTNGTTAVLQVTVFRAFTLGAAAETVWAYSRDVSLAFLAAVLVYGVFRSMFAAAGGAATTPLALIPRAMLGAVMIAYSFQLVAFLLQVNNVFVASVIRAAGGLRIENLLAGGLSDGLLFLVMGLCLLLGVVYLVLTYYVRGAEIVLLTALLPLAGALWTLEEAAQIWSAVLGEILVLIFFQSGQALVFWLFLGLGVGQGPTGAGATLDHYMTALAGIWVAIKVPGLLRNLLGSRTGGHGNWLRAVYLLSWTAQEALEAAGTAMGVL